MWIYDLLGFINDEMEQICIKIILSCGKTLWALSLLVKMPVQMLCNTSEYLGSSLDFTYATNYLIRHTLGDCKFRIYHSKKWSLTCWLQQVKALWNICKITLILFFKVFYLTFGLPGITWIQCHISKYIHSSDLSNQTSRLSFFSFRVIRRWNSIWKMSFLYLKESSIAIIRDMQTFVV